MKLRFFKHNLKGNPHSAAIKFRLKVDLRTEKMKKKIIMAVDP